MVVSNNLLYAVGTYLVLIGAAYMGSSLDRIYGKFGWDFLLVLPSVVGIGAFGAFIALLPTLVTNVLVLGCAGAASAIIGLYMPTYLSKTGSHIGFSSDMRFLRVGLVLFCIGCLAFIAAIALRP